MEDIASKLTAFLEDDKNVDLIKGVAQSFKGNQSVDLSSVGALMKSLGGEDDRSRLLRALKPFMATEKGEKMEEVIRLLQIGQLVSLYLKGQKENGK